MFGLYYPCFRQQAKSSTDVSGFIGPEVYKIWSFLYFSSLLPVF